MVAWSTMGLRQRLLTFVICITFTSSCLFLPTLLNRLSDHSNLGFGFLVLGAIIILAISWFNRQIMIILLIAFLLRASLALFHAYIYPLPDSTTDAQVFLDTAVNWSQGGLREAGNYFTTGAFLYSWLLSLAYSLLGASSLLAQAINVFFGTLIPLNVYLISKELWGTPAALRATWLSAFFPSLVLYSAIPMREPIVTYLLTSSLVFLVRWYRTARGRAFVSAVILCLASVLFHTALFAAFLALGFVLTLRLLQALIGPSHGLQPGILRYTVAILSFLSVISLILYTGVGLEKIGSVSSVSIEALQNQQEWAARSRGATYLENLLVTSPASLVWQSPIRITFFLLTPFPWMVRGGGDIAAALDASLYAVLIALFIRKRRTVWSAPPAQAILLVLLALLLLYALVTSNYGTALRHRSTIAPLFLILMPLTNHWSKMSAARSAALGKVRGP